MKLMSVTLKGFKGFKAGVGLEEVSLDLTSMPQGIIAVTGKNGMGKTTLLDNMHPFRLMPYKLRNSKNWSPASFNFYDECYGKDACREIVFEMPNGHIYKSRILIDADRRKQEAYLMLQNGDDWKPLNDGKTGTYDEALEKVLGSPTLFFTGPYRSQGARNLSSYTRGEIMSIISELLAIDGIKEQGQKAKDVADNLLLEIAKIDGELARVSEEAETLKDVKQKHEELVQSKTKLEEHIKEIEASIDSVRVVLSDAEKSAAKQEQIRQRISDAQTKLSDHIANMQQYVDRMVGLQDKLKSEQEKAVRTQKILDNASEIEAKVKEEAEAKTLIEELSEKIRKIGEELEELATHKEKRSNLIHEENRLNLENDNCQRAMDNLKNLDCKGDGSSWINEACPLLKDAMAAKEKHAEIQKLLLENLEALKACPDRSGEYEELSGTRRELADRRAAQQNLLPEIERFTKLVPELEAAKSTMKSVTERIAELEEEIGIEQKRHAELSEETPTLEQAIWVIREELDDTADERVEASKKALSEDETKLRVQRIQLESTISGISQTESLFERAEKSAAKVEELNGTKRTIEEEIANWNLLAKACSNDGIIALEIDDAGPTIAATANDLLASCYGSRFTVRIETQSEKSDGGMKEDFDITVFDAERDEEKSLLDMSGGEVTWIEDAITRAICLFNIGKSEHQFLTMFSDEKDGALDADRKQEFLKIKRRAMEIGCHNWELFITQTPELVEQADAKIVVEAGSVSIK